MTVSGVDIAVIVVYFAAILLFGSWFGRYTRTTRDFFFGGQRFSWWLIAMSCVATVVGSYSFVKYSEKAYVHGLSSTMSYLNDWPVAAVFVMSWLPLIYYTRITSIPEYLEHRFDRRTRLAGTVILLVYLVGYIGINFYTLAVAMNTIVGWEITGWPVLVTTGVMASICAVYMHAGGQTAVIMTDLLQGFLLLIAGFLLFVLGLNHVGGIEGLLASLTPKQRLPFADFNKPPGFHSVGVFWQDGIANSFAFYCMHQGIIMRFLSAKSVKDGRKAIYTVVLVLMPLAAIAVSNAGWLGRAMVTQGTLPKDVDKNKVFVEVTRVLCGPGAFGLIMAALTAALMSTVDTLIAAVSAVTVNDVWKPYVAPGRDDRYYLKVARNVAIAATIAGVCFVPLFASLRSIYEAHGAFTAAVTPPMVVVLLLGMFWRRFSARAAFLTLIGSSLCILATFKFPEMIKPFAHGVVPDPAKPYIYMRSFFGIVVSLGLAVLFTSFFPARGEARAGFVLSTLGAAKRRFKGGEPNEEKGEKVFGRLEVRAEEGLRLSSSFMKRLKAREGDILYVSDARWYLGGVRSIHIKAGPPHDKGEDLILMGEAQVKIARLDPARAVMVEKII